MKRVLCALLALGFAAQADDAEAPALTLPSEPEVTPYFDMNILDVSFAWMKDVNNILSVNNLMGATLTAGQSFGETESYYHTWYGQTGYLCGREAISTDTYQKYGKPEIYPGRYSFAQTIIPVILGYTFHYKWTENFSTYIGAQAGFYYSQTQKKVEALHNYYLNYNGEMTPFLSKNGHTQFSPTIGIEAGFVYKINKRISWMAGVSLNNTFNLLKEQVCVDRIYVKKSAITATFRTGIRFTF